LNYRFNRDNLLFILLLPSVFLLATFNICDFDSWIHLSFGRHIVENRAFAGHEIFVYPNLGAAITNPYWFFQIPLYLSYKAGGLAGVVVFKSLIVSAFFFIFAKLLNEFRVKNVYAFIFSLLTALLVRFRFVERPEIFAYLFFIIFLFILTRAYYRNTKLIYILPLIQILWANSHQSASLGILTVLVFFAGMVFDKYVRKADVRQPAWKTPKYIMMILTITILIIGGYFLNPYSYSNLFAPAVLFSDISITQSINEMQPVTFDPSYFSAYLAVLIVGILSILLNWRRMPSAWIVLFLIFSFVSFKVVRSLPLFFFISMPLIAMTASGLMFQGTALKKIYPAAISVVIAAAVFFSGIYGRYVFGFGEEKQLFASDSAAFVKKQGLDKKRIFNYFGWGGYLSWKLGEGKVFIDGRYAGGNLSNDYDHILAASSKWKELIREYEIEIIIVNSIGFSDGIIYPLIPALLSDSSWRPVYAGAGSLVFADIERNGFLQEIPRSAVFQEMVDEAGFLYSVGIRGEIEKTLGKLYLKKQEYAKAKYYYEKWLKRTPSDSSARGVYDMLNNMGY